MIAHFFRHCTVALLGIAVAFSGSLRAGQVDSASSQQMRRFLVAFPDVDYPYAARARHMQGHGLFDLWFEMKTGAAAQVKILRSTGSPLLDEAAVKGLLQWRAKPGTLSHMHIPVTFVLTKSLELG